MSSRKKTAQWFHWLHKRGRFARTKSFQVYWEIFHKQNTKFAVVIPNSVVQRAVKRNLIRRRVLAVLRDFFSGDSGVQCVVLVKRDIQYCPKNFIQQELADVFGVTGRKL